jgi:hypothetical protein
VGIQKVKSDLLDCLLAEIAVVDPTGAIVHVNLKWEETARIGMLSPKATDWNYIAECEAAIQRNCNEAVEVLAGLSAALTGRLSAFVAIGIRVQRQTTCHIDAC